VGTKVMGRVLTSAKIVNLRDAWDAERGRIPPDEVRQVTVDDALIDTGASSLVLPTRLIQQLGLVKRQEKRARSVQGPGTVNVYDAVRLWIGDRDCTVDVMEAPDDVPVLIGQVPLEILDYVVDPKGQRLIPNPAHGGEWTWELY
jgi:predicted aspartyl protease